MIKKSLNGNIIKNYDKIKSIIEKYYDGKDSSGNIVLRMPEEIYNEIMETLNMY